MEKSEAIPSAADVFIDPPPSYKLLLKCPSGLSPAQVFVDFSPSNDRTPHPDVDLEKSISEIWDQRIQENPALFNGTKFRYGGNLLHAVGDSNQESHVCLHLGLTDYRTFMGTNLSTSWEKFLVPSEDDSVRCQYTSSPLGNGAVVETADKKIVVLQRSNNVGEFPGFFVFPGGHPEPKEIGILAHQDDQNLSSSGHINKKVSQEMFNSIIREVVEEIGVPASSLVKFHDSVKLFFTFLLSDGKSSPAFIGISRREFNVRPSAFFFIKCSLLSEEIQQLYSSAEDGYESTQLFTVTRNELEKIAIKMPGCHWGGLALYKLMLETVNGM